MKESGVNFSTTEDSKLKLNLKRSKKFQDRTRAKRKRKLAHSCHHLYLPTPLKRWSRGVYERENKDETER